MMGYSGLYKNTHGARKMRESYNKKDGDKYKIFGYKGKNEVFVIYASKRNGVFDYTMTEDYVLTHFPNEECDSNDINNLNYFVKYEGLGQLIYGYLYDNGRLEDNVISIEASRGKKLDVTINIDEQGAKLLKNGWWSERESTQFFGWNTCDGSFDSYWQIQDDGTAKIYLELDIYSEGNLKESKKSVRKSIKESKMSYDEFKKICKKEFRKNEIEGFGKTDNGYGVYVIAYGEKEIELMCDDLRKHGFECKWWHSSDPDDDEPIYFIESIPINESKKSVKKSIKEKIFDNGEQLVIDIVDMLIFDFGYDKKTVEKYFYKIHKLNDFDAISFEEYIKIKEEIEKALGLDDIF